MTTTQRKITGALFCFILLHLSLIAFTNRGKLTESTDLAYWKDKYEHSQWTLPQSKRILGDEGLYLYVGYLLTKGADPTLLNAEAPPLAKYLIGFSIRLAGNPYIYAFIVSSFTLLAFFLLSELLTKSLFLSILATALFSTDALFTEQFSIVMLDSLQLLFLLLFFSLLLLLTRAKRNSLPTYSIIGGLILGLLSEVKFPIFTPVLAFLFLFVLLKKKYFKGLFLFLFFSMLGYLSPYLIYFLHGHSLRDWLGTQKWILYFYLNGGVKNTLGSAFTTLLFGSQQNLLTRNWDKVIFWNWSWTFAAIFGLFAIVGILIKKNVKSDWFPIGVFCITSLITFSLLPFYSRYLLVIIPFLYLFLLNHFQTKKTYILGILFYFILLFGNWINSLNILFPSPESDVKQLAYEWQNGFFQDIYERTNANFKKTNSRSGFQEMGLSRFSEAQIDTIVIEFPNQNFSKLKSPQTVDLDITYITRDLGYYKEHPKITLIKEKGQWRISWQWNYLMQELSQTNKIETKVDYAHRGTIYDSEGKLVAFDFPSYLIWITPNKVDAIKEDEMLTFLENLFKKKIGKFRIHQKYIGNNLSNLPVPIGVIPTKLSETDISKLRSFPGIFLTEHPERFGKTTDYGMIKLISGKEQECCHLYYSTTNYNGTRGLEQEFNPELKGQNGGYLLIKDTNNNIVRKIIDVQKREGQDVKLPYSIDQEIIDKANE